MSLVQQIRDLAARKYRSEDDEEYSLELLPPVSADEIAALEAQIPCAIPADVRDLLAVTKGFANGPLESFEFAGVPGGFEFPEIFPNALAIAHDGFGNYWVLDLLPETKRWGPVYYACHDPPVIVYQCAELAEFIAAYAELASPPFKGPIDSVHEQASSRIWSDNPGAMEQKDALQRDVEIASFAQTLDESWHIVDLRLAKTGDGFSWGRYGPRTANRRWKELPVFAYQKKTRWQRFLGR